MSKQLSDQANKVWGLLTDPTTTSTYTQTLDVTWKIIRETGNLLWLTLCLGLVGFDWFWTRSIQSGRDFRSWLTNMEKPSSDKVTVEAGKAIASVSKNSVSYIVATARKQLGLPAKETLAPAETSGAIVPAPVPAAPVAASTPVVEETAPPVSVDAATPSDSTR